MASCLARRLAEAAVAELRACSFPAASSSPSLAIALLAAPSASSIHVSAARTTSPNAFYSVTFPVASAASSALMSCTSAEAAPSPISIFVSAAPPTSPTTFPAASAASSALGPEAAPSAISIFVSASPPTSPTTFQAASAASSALGSSPTPAPTLSHLAAIGSGAEDDCSASQSSHLSPSSPITPVRTRRQVPSFRPVALRPLPHSIATKNLSSASAVWGELLRIGSRSFSSAPATPTPPPSDLSPRLPSVHITGRRHASNWAWTPWEPNKPKDKQTSHQELDSFLKQLSEVKLSPEEELKLKTAFCKKFYSEKNDDPKSVDLKLDLILLKIDELPKKILEASSMTKTEWGTLRIFGRKFDFSKLVAFLGLFFKL